MSRRLLKEWLILTSLVAVAVWFNSVVGVATAETEKELILRGKSKVWVTKRSILMSDIFDFEIQKKTASSLIAKIGNTKVGESAGPGQTVEISSDTLLEALRKMGEEYDKIGYVIPRIVEVRRESRELNEEEVRPVLEEFLANHEPDTQLHRVLLPLHREIYTGEVHVKPLTPVDQGAGRLTWPVIIHSADGEHVEVSLQAIVTRFKEVPVTQRLLSRGDVIGQKDLVRARMDVSKIPADAVESEEQLLGYQVLNPVPAGNPITRKIVKINPVVSIGAPVVMKYSKGRLLATATGVALDEGILGDWIRVRNETSRKIVRGRILSSDSVELK